MRLVTRGDLDGLTCAVLVSSCEPIDDIELTHPQQITDRSLEVTREDILANLPWHPECGKWFDNHQLTDEHSTPTTFVGRYGQAPSAARLVYEYYAPQHPELSRYQELLSETDRLDSADLRVKDIVDPEGYILLGYTLDPRTGLGDFREYFHHLLGVLKGPDPRKALESGLLQARVARMREQDARFRELTLGHSRRDGNVVVTDFRTVAEAPVGNRFLIYTLFPEANVSARIHWGPGRERVAVSVGHSILNRTNKTNIGVLMSLYGGGGHRGAGSCMLAPGMADTRIAEIVAALRRNG